MTSIGGKVHISSHFFATKFQKYIEDHWKRESMRKNGSIVISKLLNQRMFSNNTNFYSQACY